MTMIANISRRHGPVGSLLLAVASLLWMAGCTANTAELKQEIGVLLKQTMDEVRQETNRMDTEIAQIRSEVVQLRSEVEQIDSKADSLSTEVGQLGSEVALVRNEVSMNSTSLVDLAVHVNQLDRRQARSARAAQQNGGRGSRAANGHGAPEDITKTLKHGMTQQEVRRLFGNPQGKERYLDSVYWYYAEGKLKGQYVRFDATTGYVNGWSTFSPQVFQLDLRTTQGGHVR
jgi:septal ring factor EnvC (AmiA/AmiB activator)